MSIPLNEVDQYIAGFDERTVERLRVLREIAHKVIPDVKERISYGVPTMYVGDKGYVAYFAGYKDFVSVYPVHLLPGEYGEKLKPYMSGKATARFPHSKPLPKELIEEIFIGLLAAYNARVKK